MECNVPEDIVAGLKARAEVNKRSLQQELLVILEEAADLNVVKAVKLADCIREKLGTQGRKYGDSTELIRKDRDR
jgi:hypothetical protein